MATNVTLKRALDFIRYHGVVLEAAKGAEPSLAAWVAGEPIKGSWWAHPQGHAIYELTTRIRDSKAVLICTLAGGRITYVHRRLWPSFIRLSDRLPPGALDEVREVHLPSGRHKRQDVAFPEWVPPDVMSAAQALDPESAERDVSRWLAKHGVRAAGGP